MIIDRREDLLEEAKKQMADMSCRSLVASVDVRSENAVKDALATAHKEFGAIDIIVNNAAIDETVSIEEMQVENWRQIIDVNLTGPFIMAKSALPYLKKSASAHVINIASTAAKRAWPNASAYHASKWGVLGLSHAMFSELRQYNIKTTAIVAGGMRTPFLLDRFKDIDVRNLQDPKHVAETIRFVLTQPEETVIPEVMVLPMRETSWP